MTDPEYIGGGKVEEIGKQPWAFIIGGLLILALAVTLAVGVALNRGAIAAHFSDPYLTAVQQDFAVQLKLAEDGNPECTFKLVKIVAFGTWTNHNKVEIHSFQVQYSYDCKATAFAAASQGVGDHVAYAGRLYPGNSHITVQ